MSLAKPDLREEFVYGIPEVDCSSEYVSSFPAKNVECAEILWKGPWTTSLDIQFGNNV